MKKVITVFVCMLAYFSVHSMDMISENNVNKNVGSSEVLDWIVYNQGQITAQKSIHKTTKEVIYKATEYRVASEDDGKVSLTHRRISPADQIFYALQILYAKQQQINKTKNCE